MQSQLLHGLTTLNFGDEGFIITIAGVMQLCENLRFNFWRKNVCFSFQIFKTPSATLTKPCILSENDHQEKP